MLNIARAARSRYGAVLKLPHATSLLVAVAPARAPITIMGLAMVLFVREHVGSYALAGLTAGALGVMVAIGSPLLGRMVDRVGLRAVLIPATIVNSAAFVGFVIAGLSGADAWVLVALAALAGLSLPPLGSITRALWPRIIAEGGGDPGLLATALALEGVLIEGMFTIGPLLTAAISVLLDPAVALLLAPALLIIGLVMMLPLEPVRTWRTADPDHDHGMLGALRSRGLRTLMLCMLPMGFCFGAIEVTLPAFAEDHGSRAVGGALIAAWAFGSALVRQNERQGTLTLLDTSKPGGDERGLGNALNHVGVAEDGFYVVAPSARGRDLVHVAVPSGAATSLGWLRSKLQASWSYRPQIVVDGPWVYALDLHAVGDPANSTIESGWVYRFRR